MSSSVNGVRRQKEAGRPPSDGSSMSLGVCQGWRASVYTSRLGFFFFLPLDAAALSVPQASLSITCRLGEPSCLRSQVVFGSSLRTRHHSNPQGGETFKKKRGREIGFGRRSRCGSPLVYPAGVSALAVNPTLLAPGRYSQRLGGSGAGQRQRCRWDKGVGQREPSLAGSNLRAGFVRGHQLIGSARFRSRLTGSAVLSRPWEPLDAPVRRHPTPLPW